MTGVPVTGIVESAVAAQRLEGWEPAPEDLAALTSLADQQWSMTDYLGYCRRRHRDDDGGGPASASMFARRQPYLIRGTDVLENSLGLRTARVLASAEHAISAGRTVQLLQRPPSTVTPRDVHRQLFADVYAWAGEPRVTGISKGGTAFAAVHEVHDGLLRVQRDIDEAWACATGYDDAALTYRLARIYVDLNAVHPFREGNGRTGTTVLQLIAGRSDRRLALDRVSRREWVDASRASLAGGPLPDPEPVRTLLAADRVVRHAACCTPTTRMS
ncbi:MAG: Fic family protein [Gordonia sp. (in: high G+C Gram-positive bacteria)]